MDMVVPRQTRPMVVGDFLDRRGQAKMDSAVTVGILGPAWRYKCSRVESTNVEVPAV